MTELSHLHPAVACLVLVCGVAVVFLWLAYLNDSWPFNR